MMRQTCIAHLLKRKLPFEVDQQPPECEEVVQTIPLLQKSVQLRVQHLHQPPQRCQLHMHAGLVLGEIGREAFHQAHKTPKGVNLHEHRGAGVDSNEMVAAYHLIAHACRFDPWPRGQTFTAKLVGRHSMQPTKQHKVPISRCCDSTAGNIHADVV